MAVVTLLGTQTFTTANGTKTVTATPAVNDLIVIVTAHTGNTSATAPTDDQGGTYTQINTGAVKASSADQMRFWVRNALIPAASSTVFTHAPGTTSGGGLGVFKVTGMSRVGLGAIRQSAVQNNQAAATPTPVLSVAALTSNALIGAVFNATNPATMTARSSPAYGELFDAGYANPTTGLEAMSINSGETGTSIAWGGASASAFCSFIVELDASLQPPLVDAPDVPVPPRKHEVGVISVPNLLLTTLAVVAVVGVVRSPVYFHSKPKPQVIADVIQNQLILAPQAAAPFTPFDFVVPQKRRDVSSDVAPNLLTSTLVAAAPEAAPFTPAEFGAPHKRRDVSSDAATNTLTLAVVAPETAPFTPAEFGAPQKRRDVGSDAATNSLTLAVAQVPPFTPAEFSAAQRRRDVSSDATPTPLTFIPEVAASTVVPRSPVYVQPLRRLQPAQFDPANLLTSTLSVAQSAPFTPPDFQTTQRKREVRSDVTQSLPLSTLDFQPIAAAVPESLSVYPKRAVYDQPVQNWLLYAPVVRPFTPAPFQEPQPRPDIGADTSSGWRDIPPVPPFIPFTTDSVERPKWNAADTSSSSLYIPPQAPFLPVDAERVHRPPDYADTNVGSSAVYQVPPPPFVPALFEAELSRLDIGDDTNVAARDIPAVPPFVPVTTDSVVRPEWSPADTSAGWREIPPVPPFVPNAGESVQRRADVGGITDSRNESLYYQAPFRPGAFELVQRRGEVSDTSFGPMPPLVIAPFTATDSGYVIGRQSVSWNDTPNLVVLAVFGEPPFTPLDTQRAIEQRTPVFAQTHYNHALLNTEFAPPFTPLLSEPPQRRPDVLPPGDCQTSIPLLESQQAPPVVEPPTNIGGRPFIAIRPIRGLDEDELLLLAGVSVYRLLGKRSNQ